VTLEVRRKIDRSLRRAVLDVTDRGWFGRTPLKCHIVICGFPRSGSSLLQVMIGSSVADLRWFRDETKALIAARRAMRNHPFLLTKCPADVELRAEIRSFYASRRARPIFALTIRDPRDVLTSRSPRHPERYEFEDATTWRRRADAVLQACDEEDVVVIRYEELVTSPDAIERRLVEAIGWKVQASLDRFLTEPVTPDPNGFLSLAMGSPRRLDPSHIGRWRNARHHHRLDAEARDHFDIAAYVDAFGYGAARPAGGERGL
jgi:hypothetical protein